MLRKNSQIDCGVALDSGAFDTFKALRTALSAVDKKTHSNVLVDDDSLVQIPMPFEVAGARYCLAVFLFRLLHFLQFIGTVSAIDWTKYSRNFRS
jgi:hypothetical protein